MKDDVYPYEWGTKPMPLTEDSWKRVPGKKNRRDFCGGKKGRAHKWVTVEASYPLQPCGFTEYWDRDGGVWQRRKDSWRCRHETRCETCGKKLDYGFRTPCPDKPPGVKYTWGKDKGLT